MKAIPEYNELHVISDLHLGGEPGHQIFDLGAELERLIDHVRNKRAPGKLALVINGDLVDFLAEPRATYFDPEGAVDKLDRILVDPAFAMVWRSLKKLVKTRQRHLIITLGNHDIELALPWVREHLLQKLSDGDEAARGRITLGFDGMGFRCRVGKADVLCVHGNEVDTWNITDFETLRRMGRDFLQARRAFQNWIPNAGTKLVIDVMNSIKRDYPFVDLLKPELQAVVPTLLALDPSRAAQLSSITATATRLAADALRIHAGFLSAGEVAPPIEEVGAERTLERLLGETFQLLPDESQRAETSDLLLAITERRLRSGESPFRLLDVENQQERLGVCDAIWNLVRRKGRSEVLREALEKLQKDRSFELHEPDATSRQLDRIVGPGIRFIVAGHTHLERALPRSAKGNYYYNTGTWVRLMQFSGTTLRNADSFQTVMAAIQAGTMEALDHEPGLILRKPAVASFWEEQNGDVHAVLSHVNLQGEEPLLQEVPGSRF